MYGSDYWRLRAADKFSGSTASIIFLKEGFYGRKVFGLL